MFVTRENRFLDRNHKISLKDCSCGKSMGLGPGPVVMWAKLWTYQTFAGNGTGKPSTLMRRLGMELSLLLGFALTARHRWCMVTPGISRGMPDSLHQRLWPFIPTRGFLGTAWESCSRGDSLPCVWVYLARFKPIDCRPLTVIRDCLINWPWYPIMMELEKYCCMN
jgi:hypothetical protein